MAAFPSRDREAHAAHWARIQARADVVNRTVLVDGAVAGNIVSWLDEDGRRLIGYWIGREFWGRGIATDALGQYIQEVRERPLYAYVAVTNVGSARVLEKAGFMSADETEAAANDTEAGAHDIAERLYTLT
jgi:RimJ/RimL family protein N-acetyltransferase